MHKAVGNKGSVNWHDVVLSNWARLNRVDIGRHTYQGWAMYVRRQDDRPDGSLMFVVEHRGSGFPPVRFEFPFTGREKWIEGRWQDQHRGAVFEQAIAVFRRLSKQEP